MNRLSIRSGLYLAVALVGIGTANSACAQQGAETAPKLWTVLISVEGYKAPIPSRPGLNADGRKLARWMIDTAGWGRDNVLELNDLGETRPGDPKARANPLRPILENLEWAMKEWLGARVKKDDVVLIAFAGRAFRSPKQGEVLLPIDSKAGEVVWSPEASIERLLRDYKCSSVLCWVDAPIFDPNQPAAPVTGGDQLLKRLTRWPGSTVWLATGERPTGKSSAFAEALRASLGESPRPLMTTVSALNLDQNVKELRFRQVGGVSADFTLFRDRFQPPRRIKTDLLVQKGHASRISGIKIRADGHSMVTASEDSTIRIWNPSSTERALLRVLPEFLNGVTAMALSIDGRYVVGGDGMGEVIAWDLVGLDPRPIFLNGPRPHDNLIKAVAFLADDPEHRGPPAPVRFVTIGLDDRCVFWELAGRDLSHRPAPMPKVKHLLLSTATRPATSTSFVVIGEDGLLRSFDRYARSTRAAIRLLDKRPTALQLDPEGKWAAVGLEDGGVKVIELESSNVLADLQLYPRPISALKIGPDRLLAVATEGSVALVRIDDPKALARLEAGNSPVESMEFSADGGWLAASTRLGDLFAWKLEAGKAPVAVKLDQGGGLAEFACLAFGPSSVPPILVAGENDGGIRRWDLNSRKELARLSPHRGKVRQIGSTPDGRRLLQITEEGVAQVWDLREGRNVRTLDGIWSSGTFLPDGRLAMARHPNQGGGVVIVDALDGRPIPGVKLAQPANPMGDYGRVAVSRDGRQVAASTSPGRDELVVIWDLGKGSVRTIAAPHDRPLTAIDFSADGRKLMTAGEDGLVKLWNLDVPGEIKAPIASLQAPRINSISAASWSKEGPWRIVAAGLNVDDEPRAFYWELAPGEVAGKARFVDLGSTRGKILSAALLAGGKFAAVAGRDRRLMIWELAEGKDPGNPLEPHATPDHTETITDLMAWPQPGDGLTLVSGSDDTTIRFWRVEPASKTKQAGFQLLGTITSAPDENPGALGAGRASVGRIDAPWVAFTPDGVYDASLEGERLVTFADGRKVDPLDQYAPRLFHPLLTAEFLQGIPTPAKAFKPPPPLLIEVPDDLPPAQSEVEIKVVLSDLDLNPDSIRLYQNDSPVRDETNFTKMPNKKGEYVSKIKLQAGTNRLYAMASRDGEVDSRSPDLTLFHAGTKNPGRLHVLAMGIAQYTRNALLYPGEDADQLADYLARQGVGGGGREIGKKIILKDNEVDPKSVRDAFVKIRKEVEGHPEDTVVVFLAGHTDVLTTPEGQSRYSLLLPNFPFPDNAPARAVLRGPGVAAEIMAPKGAYLPYAAIYRDLTSLDALQRLVIVDACQAGAVIDDPGVRLVEQLKAMDREARPSRTSYFLASRRGEPAGEPPVLKHGLLTYIMLRGMGATGLATPPENINPFVENPTADLDGNGTITTRELRQFVDLTMPQLADALPNRVRSPRPIEPKPFDDPRLSASGPSFPIVTVPSRPNVAAAPNP